MSATGSRLSLLERTDRVMKTWHDSPLTSIPPRGTARLTSGRSNGQMRRRVVRQAVGCSTNSSLEDSVFPPVKWDRDLHLIVAVRNLRASSNWSSSGVPFTFPLVTPDPGWSLGNGYGAMGPTAPPRDPAHSSVVMAVEHQLAPSLVTHPPATGSHDKAQVSLS